MQNVGIRSIGCYLPPQVRTNDWWPADLVAEWRTRRSSGITRPIEADKLTGPAIAFGAQMLAYRDDPFEGAEQRRIMPDDMVPSDMEVRAAADAIARAGIAASELDALFVGSAIPDYHQNPNGCRVHAELGLPPHCYTLQTEGTCNAFVQQVELARALIQSGRARYVLAVQSTAQSRVLRPTDPFSAWFGDGATAVVLGPVAADHGVLGVAHVTDGRWYAALVVGAPERKWYEGENHLYLESPHLARDQLFAIAEAANPLLDRALAQAGLARAEIAAIATHQPAAWFGQAIQDVWDLPRARRIDTFSWAASLMGSNLPLVLSALERERQLAPGDVVATVSGASGMTMSVTVMRWGGMLAPT